MPSSKVYVQVNPVQNILDSLTLLWMNAFGRSLQEAVAPNPPQPTYIDVHLETIMPRVSIGFIK